LLTFFDANTDCGEMEISVMTQSTLQVAASLLLSSGTTYGQALSGGALIRPLQHGGYRKRFPAKQSHACHHEVLFDLECGTAVATGLPKSSRLASCLVDLIDDPPEALLWPDFAILGEMILGTRGERVGVRTNKRARL
jgi:hypothetical protein